MKDIFKYLHNKFTSYIIFLSFLAIGFYTYPDFGMAWDEEAQLVNNGTATFDFIKNNNPENYIKNSEKYHGPAYELVLVSLQKLINITEPPEVYYLRHILNYLLFWLCGIAFYCFLKKVFEDNFIIIIGVLWYFLMPRFFAESFYNTKDIPLYCLTILSLYSFYNFFRNPDYFNVFLHSLICGFAIGIRILGIFLPIVSLLMLILLIITSRDHREKIKLYLFPVIHFIVLTVSFIIIFWPILWLNPIDQFLGAINEMKLFPWPSTVRYCNQFMSAISLPWHYPFVWILITTPEYYLIFFLIGIYATIVFLFKNKFRFDNSNFIAFFSLALFSLALGTIIFKKPVLYDGWRHLYFLFAPILFLSLFGINSIIKYCAHRFSRVNVFLKFMLLFLTLLTGVKMIEIHPYHNVYFNFSSGLNNESKRFMFELDYWGLSYKEAIVKLLDKHPDSKLNINFSDDAGRLTLNILSKQNKQRINLTSYEEADYLITDYRWRDNEILDRPRIDSIKVNNLIISGTFKLK